MRAGRVTAAAVATGAATLLAAAPAAAHGLVGKQDLPLPRWLFGWTAALVLVISFVGLAVLWTRPVLEEAGERRLCGITGLLDPLAGLVGVLCFAGLIYAGFAGSEVETANIVPTTVFVVFWVGVPVLSVLLGDVFRAVNPWRAVGRGAGWAVKRVLGEMPEPLPYPERLGHWPAAVGIFLFAVLELVYSDATVPSHLAVLMLVYAATQWMGMGMYGTRAWSERGDAFGLYFGLFATLAPLRLTRSAVYGRVPLSGTARVMPLAGTVALLSVMIGSTSFDGFSSTPVWGTIAEWLRVAFLDLGFTLRSAVEATFLVGLIGSTLVIAGLFLLGARGVRTVDPERRTVDLARTFAPSLIPIALAYVLAHYVGLLVYQTQAMGYLLSDPLGNGANLFGTASQTIDYGWISGEAIWYVQVTVLVLGHAAGLALAHDKALVLFGSGRRATRSQYWMLAVMITFTSLALWLLSNFD
ncbi:MAG: fenitrothion hydrolase [Solirubrobacteraceae bacterium]